MQTIMMNMPDAPEGYEYTGEFHVPTSGEKWLGTDRRVRCDPCTSVSKAILRRIHKEPELVYDCEKEKLSKYPNVTYTPIMLMGDGFDSDGHSYKTLVYGNLYDTIIVRLVDADKEWNMVFYGHWNDGPAPSADEVV